MNTAPDTKMTPAALQRGEGPNDQVRTGSVSSVSAREDNRGLPHLAEMTPRDQNLWLHGYEHGFTAGTAHGRELEEADLASLQRAAVASARGAADRGPYADLADRRGEHDRADRQRELLRARGVAA